MFHVKWDLFVDSSTNKLMNGQIAFYQWKEQCLPNDLNGLRMWLLQSADIDVDNCKFSVDNQYTVNVWLLPIRPETDLGDAMPRITFNAALQTLSNKKYTDSKTALVAQDLCVQLDQTVCNARHLKRSGADFHRDGIDGEGWVHLHSNYFVYNIRFYRNEPEGAMARVHVAGSAEPAVEPIMDLT